MAEIKLIYLDLRNRGEFIRMVLTAAGQPFQDVRISVEDWFADPKYKKESPYGQVPYVIYNGKKMAQSIAIVTYFGKKFGLYGKTDEDAFVQEQAMQLLEDLRVPHMKDWYLSSGDEKAKITEKLKTELFPRYLAYFEAMLSNNGDRGYFVGDSVTVADMYLYDFMETVEGITPEGLKAFPLLQRLCTNVRTWPPLKEYLASRPKIVL